MLIFKISKFHIPGFSLWLKKKVCTYEKSVYLCTPKPAETEARGSKSVHFSTVFLKVQTGNKFFSTNIWKSQKKLYFCTRFETQALKEGDKNKTRS